MEPTPGDLHLDRLLTNFAIGFAQKVENLVADKVFPRRPVQHKSDKYPTFPLGEMLRDQMERRARSTESAGAGYTVSEDSYSADRWSLHKDVGDEDIANADPERGDQRANATNFLVQQEFVRRERQWASDFFTTGVWGTDVSVTGTDRWDDTASNPIELIADYQEDVEDATGYWPMDLVLSRAGWNKLRNHPDIIARITGGATSASPAILTMQNVAAVLGLERIHVGAGVYNSAAPGQSASISRIFGKNALLCYVDQSPDLETPTAGVTFVWSGLYGSADGRRIKSWYSDDRGAERIEIDASWDNKVTSSVLGVFFSNVVN